MALGKLRKVIMTMEDTVEGAGAVSERKRAVGGKQNLTFPQNFP